MADLVGIGRTLSLLAQSNSFQRFATSSFLHILVMDNPHITTEEFRSKESHENGKGIDGAEENGNTVQSSIKFPSPSHMLQYSHFAVVISGSLAQGWEGVIFSDGCFDG